MRVWPCLGIQSDLNLLYGLPGEHESVSLDIAEVCCDAHRIHVPARALQEEAMPAADAGRLHEPCRHPGEIRRDQRLHLYGDGVARVMNHHDVGPPLSLKENDGSLVVVLAPIGDPAVLRSVLPVEQAAIRADHPPVPGEPVDLSRGLPGNRGRPVPIGLYDGRGQPVDQILNPGASPRVVQ